jgi:hypothetical protein
MRAVTASGSLWAQCTVCLYSMLSNIYIRYTGDFCQCRLVQRHRSHGQHHFLYCSVSICCRGNVFTEPLLSNGHIYSFHYSGCQPSYHNMTLCTSLSRKQERLLLFIICYIQTRRSNKFVLSKILHIQVSG